MYGDVMLRDYGRAKMNEFQQAARTEQLCAQIEAGSAEQAQPRYGSRVKLAVQAALRMFHFGKRLAGANRNA